ncbi:MAG: hypothetical protein MK135_01210 [Polyangiaceae bacterium]|nr:hypothetical protein [Polyangiaceae bacterium]
MGQERSFRRQEGPEGALGDTQGRLSLALASGEFRCIMEESSPSLMLFTFTGGSDKAGFESFLRRATEWLQENERRGRVYAILIDPTGMDNFDAAMRRAAGEWRAAHLPLIANTCSRAAYVADSKIWRGVMTAVFWFAKPVIPVQLFSSQVAARRWLSQQVG